MDTSFHKNSLKIYAIVLTYDNNTIYVDNLLCRISKLWPKSRLVYRIPYNKFRPDFLKKKYTELELEFIKTPPDIKGTVLSLIEGFPDDEWIFWCIDDKFMIDIKEPQVQKIHDWLIGLEDVKICGVSFARVRRLLDDQNVDCADNINIHSEINLIRRLRFQHQFWIPQFFRIKVLRKVFESFPDYDFQAKMMDTFIDEFALDPTYKFYVTEKNMVVFGESASRGEATRSLARSLEYCGIDNYMHKRFSNNDMIIGRLNTQRYFLECLYVFESKIKRFILRYCRD